jgi:PAS domain S-box-containing protein
VERRNTAFARIGHRLSSAATPLEAARIITDAADQMFGWDACSFDLCSADHSIIESILSIDIIDGERRDVTSQVMKHPPSERARRVIHEGAQLLLRNEPTRNPADGWMFGDVGRPSASIMSVPIRNADCVIGLLSIHSYRKDAYQKQDLILLEAMADNCGGALQRIRVQEALRESEQRFKAVWENSGDGMRLTDSEGSIVAVNPSYSKLVGISQAQLVGRHFTRVYADDIPPEKRDAEYRQRFKKRAGLGHLRKRLKFHSGRTLELDITSSFVEVPGGDSYVLSLFRDVTEQMNLEDQLRHSQKMDAIGQLAGGVAHDFNNILTVIQGHASLIRNNSKLPQELSKSAQQIAKIAERAGELTRQLLTLSRRQIIRRKRCDLNDSVRQISSMLDRILGEDIVLEARTSETAAAVEADAGMMEQVIMNLSVNARDAMPRGGFLRIATERVEITEGYTRLRPDARPGSFIRLSVQDTGEGISEQNLLRIFEPFFTTKETGKGTGLGLPTVYGIVKLHEGWIEVESEVGAGSTFRVFLPLSSNPMPPAEEQVARPPEHVAGGNETILLAEDESAVRNLVHKVLARHGYQVLAADSGQQALDLWRENKDKIHLLLTDIIMPGGMNGRELAEMILAERPDLKVLYSSGYSADVAGKDFVLEDGVNFLSKPYHPRQLATAIRQCLDRQPA